MKRLESMISIARELSQNSRYDADSGLSQVVFTRFFKSAQDNMYKAIQNTKTKAYMKEIFEDIVPQQSFYAYPADIYLQAIDTLEWSQDGNNSTGNEHYITLGKGYNKERLNNKPGWPFSYIAKEGGYILNPPLSGGTLRINYIRVLPEIEKRSGQISALTLAGQDLTALTINPAEASFDPSYLGTDYFLCVVDKFGRLKAAGIQYDSVNTVTGVFTMPLNTLATDETVAVGDYVVLGSYAVNIPEMADICENYLIKYAVYSAKYGDSSQWTEAAVRDMGLTMAPIVDSYARLSDDVTEVMISNTDYLGIG